MQKQDETGDGEQPTEHDRAVDALAPEVGPTATIAPTLDAFRAAFPNAER